MSRVAVLLCLLLAPACERKAPDPSECLAMAEAALRPLVERGHHPGQLLAQHDELVRECLVTPFDDQLVACVERTGAYRACRADFELRRRIPR